MHAKIERFVCLRVAQESLGIINQYQPLAININQSLGVKAAFFGGQYREESSKYEARSARQCPDISQSGHQGLGGLPTRCPFLVETKFENFRVFSGLPSFWAILPVWRPCGAV